MWRQDLLPGKRVRNGERAGVVVERLVTRSGGRPHREVHVDYPDGTTSVHVNEETDALMADREPGSEAALVIGVEATGNGQLGPVLGPVKPTAKQRRMAALEELHRRFLTADFAGVTGTREERIAAIEGLAGHGRTDAWRAAIARWADLVRQSEDQHWAWVQGGLYPVWADA